MYSNESKNILIQQFLFEVSLLWFNFVSALQYLDYYYNEYPVNQTNYLYLKLRLKSAFYSVFSIFLKRFLIFKLIQF